ncbi:MAG: hypothetical protein AB1430_18385 [Pseudomonadota bacterium]
MSFTSSFLHRAMVAIAVAGVVPTVAAADDTPQRGGEPNVQQTVLEDDQVRIEELKVRGQAQRVMVRPKLPGAKPYEIVTGDAGRDPNNGRGAAGQRVWNVLGF